MKIYRTWMLCALLGIYTLNLISQTKLYITDFGAKGDGTTDDTQAIQQAIDACEKKGGGTIVFPKDKTFICGPVELKGNIEYRLEEGSVWKAKGDEREYTKSAFKDNRGEGMLWIWAKDRSNISFTGNGSVDGNGVAFMGKELDDSYELKPLDDPRFDPRPHVITLIGIKNVSVKNITIREGAYWTLHLIGCENATIDSVKLHNNIKIRNGDGIDIDHSRHVVVRNCDIVSGDDCVCLKNRREWEEYGVCKDITVENCRMRSRSCAVKIGSENMDSICQVVVRNCEIWGSNRGLGIQNRDEGSVSDVTFENIRMECLLWSDLRHVIPQGRRQP
jgi:polygalacturonase